MPLPATPLTRLPVFDPRQVAVLGSDAHLPAVQPDRMSPAALRQRFTAALDWAPEVLTEKRFMDREPAHASVLIPVVMRGDAQQMPTVLLTERAGHLATHSGQIAFPGGKADPGDADAAATALREAHEEVGLEHGFVQVLGHLPVYITGSAFIVTPVVALVDPGYRLRPNPDEVADAFEVPLDFLMNPANHRRHVFDWQGQQREWFSMPWQDTQHAKERFIWGATAGMLRNFYRFLSA